MTETRTAQEPIKPDYSQAWVMGEEHVNQEGTSFWQQLREAKGWSREDVWELTDGYLDPAQQALIEGEYGVGGVYELEHLILLAVLYGRKPGELLDECYESTGKRLLDEEHGQAE